MAIWNIFYDDSTKLINWSSNATVDDSIKTEQASAGLSHLSVEQDAIPSDSDFWVNSAGNGIIEKSIFDPTFSTTTPVLEAVVNITGLPTGTEVFIDEASAGTMSDTTLTLTASEPGAYTIRFEKVGYKKWGTQKITVKRYGE